eukprot:CAMPEP_0184680496 /NCGR_PEP_ID=MMETSP0312-20130426/3371_1 /TAXON_ID=31354 /ORGANISM="Compsopogon coeruleus, Strain SAG 36.94" /LENGTH=405 /DNA_ID=CAMNT_0027130637 /DNA_START=168 /DNA_END=1382 /DNA_ORIENTATION=-
MSWSPKPRLLYTMRGFLIGAYVAVTFYESVYARASKSPNMIVYLADDIGQINTDLYVASGTSMPNLKAMARNGTVLDIVWSTPMCQPSRAMALTGLYGYQTKWWYQANFTAKQTVNLASFGTWANKAREQGYLTMWIGKMQLTFGKTKDYGFDEYCLWRWSDVLGPAALLRLYDGPKCGRNDLTSPYWYAGPLVINDQFIPTNARTFGPLVYLDCMKNFIRRAKAANKKFLIYFADDLCHADWNVTGNCQNDIYAKMPILNPQGRIVGMTQGTPEACYKFLDTMLGLVRDFVRSENLWSQTVLLFSADNPAASMGKKQVNRQDGTRVPFFAYGGPIKKRSRISYAPFSFADLYATVLDFIGSPPDPTRKDSASFKNLLTGRNLAAPRKWIFSYYDHYRMIRTKDW